MTLLEFQEFVRELGPKDKTRFRKLFDGIYTVAAGGHGSRALMLNNPPEELTFDAANEEAKRWCMIADTIGGTAAVINFVTGEIIAHY